ncbi:hypothetical protein LF1_56820 [Rubripirellula obstinata]|uniref:HEAT repeat protein n=1 Tax=Rubripirellula obstinata TaxID=406547 RepID=A0A5B1CCI1_9BACT|nr:hypothetical protein [Rubripirellula obstinata]KAA1257044.1 hypothetical protein LF1_56820 [Rubripirellula obstinata]
MDPHEPTKYELLPDSMAASDLETLFNELLLSNTPDPLVTTNALYELATRQWHTYEPLAPSVAQRIDDWLVTNWDTNSLAFTDTATAIVAHLRLPRTLQIIRSLVGHPDPEIDRVIRGLIAELDVGDPLDPWWDLRNL